MRDLQLLLAGPSDPVPADAIVGQCWHKYPRKTSGLVFLPLNSVDQGSHKEFTYFKGRGCRPHLSMEGCPNHSIWDRTYIDVAIFEKCSLPQCTMPPTEKILICWLTEPRKIDRRKIINKQLCLKMSIVCISSFIYSSNKY